MFDAEFAAIRRRDPDVDARDITAFTFPLLARAAGVLAIGLVPLLVVRAGGTADALLVPLIGSFALTIVCTAVVAWLGSIVISGLVVMILYRTPPTASSSVVARILRSSFQRIEDSTSRVALIALVAGLLSLAIGLPTRHGDEEANSVIEDLLAAQVGVLLVALGIAFVAESIRSAADIVDDQSLMLAWPWALVIACLSWMLATMIGPFETTRMLTILLNEWLPASVDGVPRSTLIGDLVPGAAQWWAAFGPLPFIAMIWAFEVWRHGGFGAVRDFLADDGGAAVSRPP